MHYLQPSRRESCIIHDISVNDGRMEKGFGVYMADRNTVNLSERMKVTVCLNPVHSATGPIRSFCCLFSENRLK